MARGATPGIQDFWKEAAAAYGSGGELARAEGQLSTHSRSWPGSIRGVGAGGEPSLRRLLGCTAAVHRGIREIASHKSKRPYYLTVNLRWKPQTPLLPAPDFPMPAR
jgi:hypothetical protein